MTAFDPLRTSSVSPNVSEWQVAKHLCSPPDELRTGLLSPF